MTEPPEEGTLGGGCAGNSVDEDEEGVGRGALVSDRDMAGDEGALGICDFHAALSS